MEPQDTPNFDTEDAPTWVKNGAGILAFLILTVTLLACAFVMFFLVVRFGLWLFGL